MTPLDGVHFERNFLIALEKFLPLISLRCFKIDSFYPDDEKKTPVTRKWRPDVLDILNEKF